MLTMEDMREFFYNIEKHFVVAEIEKLSWIDDSSIPIPSIITKMNFINTDTYNGKKLKPLLSLMKRSYMECDYMSYKMGELYEKHHEKIDFPKKWKEDNIFFHDIINKYHSNNKKLREEAILLMNLPVTLFSVYEEESEPGEPNDAQA